MPDTLHRGVYNAEEGSTGASTFFVVRDRGRAAMAHGAARNNVGNNK